MHALRRSPQPANPASQASERASSYACLCACASSVYFTCTYARMLDERSRYIIYIYMYMCMYIRSFYGKESDFLRSTLTPRQERRPIEGDRNRDYATEERGGGEDRPSSFLSSSLLFPSFPPQHASSLLTLMRWPAGRFLQHRPFQLSPIHRDGVPSRDSSCIVK